MGTLVERYEEHDGEFTALETRVKEGC